MSTATQQIVLSDLALQDIESICVRPANSKRAKAYTYYNDLVALCSQWHATKLEWDGIYGCYVMTEIGGKLATMMVFVNREPQND